MAAAATSHVDALRAADAPPLATRGERSLVGLWDEAAVRATHADFAWRVRGPDGSGVADHSTHVAGTIIGAGRGQALALGMAPGAHLLSYDWTLDLAEMRRVAPYLTVSNHAYGYAMGWADNPACADLASWLGRADEREDRRFGAYGRDAAELDAVLYETGLLSVWAGGNEREDVGAAGGQAHHHFPDCNAAFDDVHESELALQWDTMGQQLAAKSSIVVGAVGHVTEAVPEPGDVVPMGFSSFGPMDDGRIKPDLVAAGELIFSPVATGDLDYGSFSGTSGSAAVVSGGAVLLREYYQALHDGLDPRADELKAVLLHTAQAAGEDLRPDYRTGFGLFDAWAAGELIAADAAADADARRIRLGRIGDGETVELSTREVAAGEALRVTLVWFDPPGVPNDAGVDDRTPALVNDLDLTLIAPDGSEHFPWSLDPDDPEAGATATGKNGVDTVERIDVAAADNVWDGAWTVRVSIAGRPHRLRPQDFALVSSVGLSAFERPVLGSARSQLVVTQVGQAVDNVQLPVRNLGGGDLSWTARASAEWLSLSSTEGSGDGSIELAFDVQGLAAGTYFAPVELDAGEAGRRTIGVALRVQCVPDCEGFQCGVDPVCGEACGGCGLGEACDGGGSCLPFVAGCPGLDLGSQLGMQVALGSTEGAGDDDAASCGGDSGADVTFRWTAPSAGRYRFTTDGSKLDTVLYLRDGCGGDELACSDDAEGTASSLTATLAQGQQLQVTVDGKTGAGGQFYLYIGRAGCPDAELGQAMGDPLYRANVRDSDDTFAGSCGGEAARDVVLAWQAPETAEYVFTARGAAALYVRDGDCEGEELACSDDVDDEPTVTLSLEQGQRVVLMIETAAPYDFELSVSSPGAQCLGSCGGSPNGGGCFCDAACTALGDCCVDACDSCGSCCVPDCNGRSCGPDGCGGSCGSCGEGELCSAVACVPDPCVDLESGDACDDRDGCTEGDRCVGGRCAGTPRACAEGGCDLQLGLCPEEIECQQDADCEPSDPCRDALCSEGLCVEQRIEECGPTESPPPLHTDAGAAEPDHDATRDDGGCGCRVGPGAPSDRDRPALVLLLLAWVALRIRRRRPDATPPRCV